MTGPKGNSEFCSPETFNVPRGEAEENIEVEGNKTHCFPWGQSLSVLLYLPTQKYNKLNSYIREHRVEIRLV